MERYVTDTPEYRLYKYHFSSIADVVNYLKDEPEINTQTFKELMSKSPQSFYGESLEITLDKLINGYQQEYKNFLSMVGSISCESIEQSYRSKSYRSYVGSRVDIPAYVAGSPRNMRRILRHEEKKIKTVWFKLTGNASIKPMQTANRGIITMKLIKALENAGYYVDLRAFELEQCDKKSGGNYFLEADKRRMSNTKTPDREIFYLTLNLKDLESALNESKCIGPFMCREFQRRCLFRIIETTPLSWYWGRSYGWPLKPEEDKEILGVKEEDIYIGDANYLGVKGENLNDDINIMIKKLGLENIVVSNNANKTLKKIK